MDFIKNDLDTKGYAIVENVLSNEEIQIATDAFHKWRNSVPNLNERHSTINSHGIYKFHQVGHQYHAWFLRTRDSILNIFKQLWNTTELVASFDGCCYMPKEWTKKDTIWTHTDQAPNYKGIQCHQSFVSLTDNQERTLVVYEGSHKLHEKYFKDRGIESKKNWHKIDKDFVQSITDKKRVLKIKKGSLVIWDSRTFHQNQNGKPNSEERLVQYLCYLPKDSKENTKKMEQKRIKYFNERRTTSHWPYPLSVNGLQPQIYGDKSKLINYQELPEIEIDSLMDKIVKLI